MNIYIIGSGTFGTALANELSFNINNQVLLFARSVDKVNEINNLHTNEKYFPNIKLNQSLKATNDYFAIKEADVVFIALPSSPNLLILLKCTSLKHSSKSIPNACPAP